jgi:hypothetical protein
MKYNCVVNYVIFLQVSIDNDETNNEKLKLVTLSFITYVESNKEYILS